MSRQLIVIGGGAAGFFCAVNAARFRRDLQVTILEKTGKLLSKVKVSGGGRCNVTHHCFDIADMSASYPRGRHFVKKSFHQFFTTDAIQWFDERGVKLKTESDGRMFPVTDSSQTIINCLMHEADKYGVKIIMDSAVERLKHEDGKFFLGLSGGRTMDSDYLCIAAGGYSKLSMFDWIKESGHTIEAPVPSLFTFNLPRHPLTGLMGVSVEKAIIKIKSSKLQEQGPLLITHWGLSGPVILRLSAWGARELASNHWRFSIHINWLPDHNEQSVQTNLRQHRNESASSQVLNRCPFGLPQRLWRFLATESGILPDTRWADLPSIAQNRLAKNLCSYECMVDGKTTFKEEFVTAGGVRLNEVDANTMMSKKINGLFFAGEVLDVDGITGGYNFQHAWTSGYISAKSIATL